MRENMKKVIECFKAGKACKGDSKATCSTDGNGVGLIKSSCITCAIGSA